MKKTGKGLNILIVLEALVLAAVIVTGVLFHIRPGGQTKEEPVTSTQRKDEISSMSDTEDEEAIETSVSPAEEEFSFPKEVVEKAESMTMEEKAAQIFLVSPEDLMNISRVTQAGSGTRNAIDEYPVGGLYYSSLNFTDKSQTKDMLEGVQSYMQERIGLPAFLAIEELGGESYSPLAAANQYDMADAPCDVGTSVDASAAYDASESIAGYMMEEGFNMVLGPVADLSASDARSYGTDSKTVTMMVAESISAFHTAGIAAAVSSFPEDPGTDLTSYMAAISGEAEFMVLDEDSSFDEERIAYIRDTLGYHGIIMTAYFSSDSITEKYSAAEAAVAAINAGADMIYAPEDFREAYQGVLDAVESGEIAEETINEAVEYILNAKM